MPNVPMMSSGRAMVTIARSGRRHADRHLPEARHEVLAHLLIARAARQEFAHLIAPTLAGFSRAVSERQILTDGTVQVARDAIDVVLRDGARAIGRLLPLNGRRAQQQDERHHQ